MSLHRFASVVKLQRIGLPAGALRAFLGPAQNEKAAHPSPLHKRLGAPLCGQAVERSVMPTGDGLKTGGGLSAMQGAASHRGQVQEEKGIGTIP